MTNPPPPISPNITTGAHTGRVATDRYDFESHLEGTNFRHHADQIDLVPNIDGYTNVQQCLTAFAVILAPPVIPDATTISKGIITLAGDLGGTGTTAAIPKVSGLQGHPVSVVAPTLNYVLTWDGYVWTPIAPANAFFANGDLAGNAITQTVINLSGAAGTVGVSATTIRFVDTVVPVITQATRAAIGQPLTISAQASSTAAGGGNVIISGGASPAGLRGGVSLQINTTNLLQATEVIAGQRVLSLLKSSALTSTEMPSLSGDMVMYIADTVTPPDPTAGPVGGTILYSYAGQLYIKQPNLTNFYIGSIPNPSTWGTLVLGNGNTISYRNDGYTTTTSPALVLNEALTDNATTRIDVLMVGKKVGSTDSSQYNLSMGYTREAGGAPQAVGTLTNADSRTNVGGVLWTDPDITISGNNVQVKTGYKAATNIYWTAIIQLTICKSA